MVAPFVSAVTAERIRDLGLRGFATRLRINGPTTLVLARWDAVLGRHVARPPQAVLMAYANRAAEEARGGASAATLVDGYFEQEAPADWEEGDLFAVDGIAGRIEVTYPPVKGLARAGWVVRTGEAT